MKLYGYFRSSAAYRVRIALNLKGLAYEQASIHLVQGVQHDSAFRKLNPQELVPVLEDDGLALSQSLAICEYLDEVYPQPPLLPASPRERARVRALALAVACDIHPLNNLRVLQYLENNLGLDKDARKVWYCHWVAVGLKALEAMLADDPATGRYCHGDRPTLADVCLVPQVANALRTKCPVDDYPTVRRIYDACLELPAFNKARPEKQPDAE